MMRKHLWCNIIGSALGSLALAPALILLLDRREPTDLIIGRIEPLNVRVTELIEVIWTQREHRVCDGNIWQVFVDHQGIIHPAESIPAAHYIPSDSVQTFSITLVVPKGMAVGPAIYTSKIERWCNPLQRILWPIKADGLRIPFNVIE